MRRRGLRVAARAREAVTMAYLPSFAATQFLLRRSGRSPEPPSNWKEALAVFLATLLLAAPIAGVMWWASSKARASDTREKRVQYERARP